MKKIFIPAMLLVVTIAISSCSEDVPNNVGASVANDADLVAVNVASGTSRGSDQTTTTLNTAGSKVKLHIVDSGTADASTLTQGGYLFTTTGTDWSQDADADGDGVDDEPITWEDIDFPAHFFSLHDGDPKDLTTTAGTATLDYAVTDKSSTAHKDLVFHASKLDAIPMGSTVNLFHKHALSKIHLYASTGDNKLYIARVNFVNVDGDGTATVTSLAPSESLTALGISWANDTNSNALYEYFFIGNNAPVALQSSALSTGNPIINEDDDAPFMIIPQTTVAATKAQIAKPNEDIVDSYFEVIYYLTDADDKPIVGYSAVSKRPDAADFVDGDQNTVLYVKGAFPINYPFVANKEYDITLGLGAKGSSGGLLVDDFYVDKNGDKVCLTRKDGGTTDPEIPGVDEGDDILGDSSDEIDITVSSRDWEDGGDIPLN